MSLHHDAPFDAARPALTVTVGNTSRRHRPLDRDVIVLGRAHGCDIGLSAPDVSSVHCLIYRAPDGLRLRDCQSRIGTHLNGETVQEALLHDGDTLQVGPFSFQVYLPPGFAPLPETEPPPPDAAAPSEAPVHRPAVPAADRLEHAERSRRRWARLALSLRQRLQEERRSEAADVAERDWAARQTELDQQAEFLRNRARDYEQRARRLEEAERALAADRTALDADTTAFHHLTDQVRRQLEQRQAEVEDARPQREALREEARRLDLRRRELDAYANHLWRTRREFVSSSVAFIPSAPEPLPTG